MKRTLLSIAIALIFAATFANNVSAQVLAPQGRLTLQSHTPVMTSDVVGASTLYYTPYQGNSLVVSNGTSTSNQTFSELSLNVASTAVADQLYDVYAITVSSALQLCLVGGWNPDYATRGSGFQLTMLQGIWVNASLINLCYTPTNTYTVPAKTGVYLGTIYTSTYLHYSSVGLTVMFRPSPSAGGTRNMIGVWNAYNRVPIVSRESDSLGTLGSWTSTFAGWTKANNPSTADWNNISFVDGLQQSSFTAQYQVIGRVTTPSSPSYTSIGIDNDTTTFADGAAVFATTTSSGTPSLLTSPPVMGLHYVEAMEYAGSSTSFGMGIMTLMLQITM